MKPRAWIEIVNGASGGAAAHAATSALVEADGRWLTSVGQPTARDAGVVRVTAWADAVSVFHGEASVNPNGTLDAPMELIITAADEHPDRYDVANAAAHAALDALNFSSSIPEELGMDDNVALGDYFTEFVRFLFLEIYLGDRMTQPCTYFRDQLGWFVAGFFPCGWEGEWPHGRMRVF